MILDLPSKCILLAVMVPSLQRSSLHRIWRFPQDTLIINLLRNNKRAAMRLHFPTSPPSPPPPPPISHRHSGARFSVLVPEEHTRTIMCDGLMYVNDDVLMCDGRETSLGSSRGEEFAVGFQNQFVRAPTSKCWGMPSWKAVQKESKN